MTVHNSRYGRETTVFDVPADLGWKNGILLCEELLSRFDFLTVSYEIADEDYIESGPTHTFANTDDFRKTTALLKGHQPTIIQLKFHY